LLIFDCCYAGNLIIRDGRSFNSSRNFECIAACGPNSTTAFPGPNSFTTALIWALKALWKDGKKFTTLQLQTMIMKAEGFDQLVPVGECNEPCDQRLILAPAPILSEPNFPIATTSTSTIDELPQNFVDLRFWYSNSPSEREVESLARRFMKLMRDQIIGAHRIEWRGLKNVDQVRSEKLVRPAAEKWLSLARLNPGRKVLPQASLTVGDNGSTGGNSSISAIFGSCASHSSSSDPRLDVHDEEKEGNESAHPRFKPNREPREPMERLLHDLNTDLSMNRGHFENGTNDCFPHDDMSVGEGFVLIGRRVWAIMSCIMQAVYPILKIVAIFLLCIYAWYAMPTGLRSVFDIQ